MIDSRLQKLASLLVNYCVQAQPGDRVVIMADVPAQPLVRATYRAAILSGSHPFVHYMDDDLTEILLQEATDNQLAHVPEPLELINEQYDCRIYIGAPDNTRTLSGVDSERQRLRQQARGKLTARRMERAARGEYRWTTTRYPTSALAQEADMSQTDFAEFVFRSCKLHEDDPAAAWRQLAERQQRLVDWLAGKEEVVVKGPNVDLRLSIAGRTFINSDGKRNMPSGEIFTGPVRHSVNGWVRYTYPAIYEGRAVSGVELRFEEGRVVEARAQKNEAFLHSILDTDEGARYLGEFAIGTNDQIDRFTGSILYDEKIGGTIHMAVGNGYPETGSQNQSSVHWDMICDMRDGGQIWIDGELFYDSGRFTLLEERA
ncbi:MAG: aminopeptidase [Candidatus Promineifilaceae bacterium]|nr:aminopeptidase [Candidatus Promineifilaceae bacterium]